MDEFEQDGLLEEAETLMGEATNAFFDGDLNRAARLADAAAVRAWKVGNANPTREGIDALMSRLSYIVGAMERFAAVEERDV